MTCKYFLNDKLIATGLPEIKQWLFEGGLERILPGEKVSGLVGQSDQVRLAPNGKPSNLNALQYQQVRTKEFKAWFGDWENDPVNASKVMDENGEPLVVYHKTPADFSEFSADKSVNGMGIHFGSIKAADAIPVYYAESKQVNYMPVFLNIRNMTQENHDDGHWGAHQIKQAFERYWQQLPLEEKKALNARLEKDGYGYGSGFAKKLYYMAIDSGLPANESNKMIADLAYKYGMDGISYKNAFEDKGSLSYMVIKPNQIKSATGNTGAFSSASDDIRFSRSFDEINDIIDSGYITKPKQNWQEFKDGIAIAMTDSTLPLRRWAERTFKDNPVVAYDVWKQFDLSPSRSQAYMNDMNKRFKNKLAESLKALRKAHPKIDNDAMQYEVGLYASAKYALSENIQWLGYTPGQLQDIADKLEAKYGKPALKATLQPVYDMNQQRLRDDVAIGKLPPMDAIPLQANLLYVPLLDNDGLSDSFAELESTATFKGFKPFKEALKAAYDYAVEAEETDDNEVIKKKYGISKNKNNYTVTDELAASAMDTMNVEKTPTVFKHIKAFTQFQSRMITLMMMGFAPTNMIRDTLERTENLRARKIVGFDTLNMDKISNTAIMNALANLKDIKAVMMPVLAENTPMAKLFKLDTTNDRVKAKAKRLREFLSRGASSTYGDMLNFEHEKLADDLRKRAGIPHKIMDGILLWNNAFELISGFSVYESLVDNDVEADTAAETTLNLMNFHKSGRITSPLRALWLFFNPIAQGGSQLYQTLSTKKGAVRFAVMTGIAAMLYSMLRGADDDDDELGFNRMDRSGNFKLYRNIRIPLSLFGGEKGEYFDVPMGFGVQQLALALGTNLTRMNEGDMTAKEFFYEGAIVGLKAVAPISPAESNIAKNPAVWLAQTLTPQFLKPIINVGLNVNAFGGNLTNDKYMKLDTPKSEQGMRNTPPEYKDAAKWLFETAGIDMYPEQIRELLRGYGAGLPNELAKVFIDNPAKEARGLKTADWYSDRWLAVSNDSTLKQTFYYELREKTEAAQKLRFENPDLSGDDLEMAKLGDELKKKENHVKGKYAAATKAEKKGQDSRAEFIRKVADKQKAAYEDYAINRFREIEGE